MLRSSHRPQHRLQVQALLLGGLQKTEHPLHGSWRFWEGCARKAAAGQLLKTMLAFDGRCRHVLRAAQQESHHGTQAAGMTKRPGKGAAAMSEDQQTQAERARACCVPCKWMTAAPRSGALWAVQQAQAPGTGPPGLPPPLGTPQGTCGALLALNEPALSCCSLSQVNSCRQRAAVHTARKLKRWGRLLHGQELTGFSADVRAQAIPQWQVHAAARQRTSCLKQRSSGRLHRCSLSTA